MVTVVGFIVLGCFIYSALKEIMNVQFAFILFPVIGALILGHNFAEIAAWVITGVKNNASMIAMIVFILPFFQAMNEVGAFDGLVAFINKKFNKNVMAICFAGWLVSIISSLDGAAPSTVLVTVSAMLPIYIQNKIRPLFLGLQMALVLSFLGLFPYSGKNLGFSAVLGTDASAVFSQGGLLVALIIGAVAATVIMVIFANMEIKRIHEGKNDYLLADSNIAYSNKKAASITERQLKMRPLNIALIVILLVCMIGQFVNSVLISMICCSIAFVINYPDSKSQQAAFRRFAPMTIVVSGMFLGAGPFTQIMNGTGMMGGIVKCILSIMPAAAASRLHVIAALLYTPIDCFLSSSVSIYGLSPIIFNTVNTAAGITAVQAHAVFMAGDAPALLCSISGPAVYLMLEMLGGIKLRDFTKYAILPLWAMGIIMILTLVAFGYAF